MRVILAIVVGITILVVGTRLAHGDSLAGQAARDALRTGDFTPVAAWVTPADEPALLAAFQQARARRAMWPDVDREFVAYVERVHRERLGATAGEYEELVAAALATGDDDAIVEHLAATLREGLQRRVRETKVTGRRGDVDAGRARAAAYRELVQYVAAVARAAAVPPPVRVAPVRHER